MVVNWGTWGGAEPEELQPTVVKRRNSKGQLRSRQRGKVRFGVLAATRRIEDEAPKQS
jgi:hypothetical protein